MLFAKAIRARVVSGEITCSIRFWHAPRVRVGGVYRVGTGSIVIGSVRQIALADITGDLARRSGFAGVIDLLKVARHGSGENIYLVEFEYRPPAV